MRTTRMPRLHYSRKFSVEKIFYTIFIDYYCSFLTPPRLPYLFYINYVLLIINCIREIIVHNILHVLCLYIEICGFINS